MDSYTSIRVHDDGPIRRIVLSRPEVRNAHDLRMFQELVSAFDDAERDDSCRCVVLAADGPVFCAGQDLRFMATATARDKDEYGRWNVAARQRIQRNFKPLQDQVENWKRNQLDDDRAKAIIFDAFIGDKLDAPKHLAREVAKHYFLPQYPEFEPRTEWSLNNAFTSAFKLLDPLPQFRATASLGKLMGMTAPN